MAGAHHGVVDPSEEFRCEKVQVILQRLQFVGVFIVPVGVSQHLPERVVLIGQFLEPVVVGIEPQTDHAQYQDLPLLHARSPQGMARLFPVDMTGNDILQYRKDLLSEPRGLIDVL